jgi:hypothetical protein
VTISEVIITDIYPKSAKAQVVHISPGSVIQKGMFARLVAETELAQEYSNINNSKKGGSETLVTTRSFEYPQSSTSLDFIKEDE